MTSHYLIELRDPNAGPAYQLTLHCRADMTLADAWRVVRVARRAGQGARVSTQPGHARNGLTLDALLSIVRQ